jgi:hypothetical protein
MTCLSQFYLNRRAPRFHLTKSATAIVGLQDGGRMTGEMLIISRTGGVLSLSETLSNGSFIDLELQTHLGTVRGPAEMLAPVAYSEQPFRFLSLSECDQRRLGRAFESGLYRNIDEEEWIEELRAAAQNWNLEARSFSRPILLGLLTLGSICLAVYALHTHLFLR